MLLLMLATTMADRQEATEPQEAMPQMRVSCYTDAEQSAGTNVLHFSARYKGTGTSASAGQANADATFIMRYE